MISSIAGVILIVLAVVPLYSGLRAPVTGLAGSATAEMAAAAAGMTWMGSLFACAVGICTARILDPVRTTTWIAGITTRIRSVPSTTYAAAVSFIALVLAMITERLIFHNEPVLLDAMVQLDHARHIATGAGHMPADTIGFFRMQQTATVTGGWISQYPPLHVVLLAAATLANAPWIAGPMMLALAILVTSLALDLLTARAAAARIGVFLAACSPFMLAHAATYMSHTTAAACIGLALYGFARAIHSGDAKQADHSARLQRGATGWLVVCGLGIGAAFATRPLTGVTMGVALTAIVAMRVFASPTRGSVQSSLRHIALSSITMVCGALPFIIAVAMYNHHYFGSFTKFGYDVALGPNAGLGFGIDPWGNTYGLKQAVQYTSAEMVSLSLQLFETPIPLVALIGVFLLARGASSTGEKAIAIIALAPLVSHMFYWHHGLFMGPRMLNDYGIVWSALAITAIAHLYHRAPSHTNVLRGYSPQTFFVGAMATAFFGALLLAPQRLRAYSVPASQAYALAVTSKRGGVVFVHGGWGERESMQLAARGWRLDEVESAIRQNSSCAVQRVIDGDASRSSLDLAPRATRLPRRVEFPRGNPIRVTANEPLTTSCARQVRADSAGIIDPSSLLWRGGKDIPLFARDLGPDINISLARTDRDARVLVRGSDGEPSLMPYDDAMRMLWKDTQ